MRAFSNYSYTALGACPFCNQAFKSPGALANHMGNVHPNLQYRPRKRKHGNRCTSEHGTDVTQDLASTSEFVADQDLEQRLTGLFSHSGVLSPQEHDCGELPRRPREEIIYYRDEHNVDPQDSLSDANTPTEDGTISFPVEREAGKVIAAHRFLRQRDPTYNFFQPFQNALDCKLARFCYSAHVPKARIDKFFKDGFLGGTSDTERSPLAPIYRTRFSFHAAHGLYRKLDDMIIDPAWKNGVVYFRLGKGTEFWYRDVLQVLKYLLRRKSFALHMFWAPVMNFDGRRERVYMEMTTASW